MPLRVAFNATPLLSPLTGIGNYIVNLGRELATMQAMDAWSFYGYRLSHKAPTPPRPGPASSAGARALKDLVKRFVPMNGELRQAQQQIAFGRGLRRHGIDLYHEPNYVPIRRDVPFVLTVHDLSWLRYPQTHPRDRIRWLERGLPRALAETRMVLVDSDFVRGEVLERFGLAPERVRTVHLGVADGYRPQSPADTASVLRSLGLEHGAYLLTVATIEPRKNLDHLLHAYAALPGRLRERYPLVVAGARGWRADSLEKTLRALTEGGRSPLSRACRGAGAAGAVCGRGLVRVPVALRRLRTAALEAMACGVPVLASNRASLPEIVGEAGILIDPDDAGATAARIEGAARGPRRARELSRRGPLFAPRASPGKPAPRPRSPHTVL